MKALGSWLHLIQKGIHAGSGLWFLGVVLFIRPDQQQEWRDLRILLFLNFGTALLNILIYTVARLIRGAK